jgi:predicted RecA/RadA family phage recombinase
MTNYVQPGEILNFTAPVGGVVSGQFYVHGTLVVCATVTAAAGETYAGKICGVFRVAKVGSQAWTQGAAVYLVSGQQNFSTTAGGNTAAGIAAGTVGAGAGETEGLVLLNGLCGGAI